MLNQATHGIQNTTMTANRIIDEVMAARSGEATLKAKIDALLAAIGLRALVATIIAHVNASTEEDENEDPLLINKAKVEVPDHQDLTGRTGAEDRHAIGDIQIYQKTWEPVPSLLRLSQPLMLLPKKMKTKTRC